MFPRFFPPFPYVLMANSLFLLVTHHLLAHQRGDLVPEAAQLPEPALPPGDRARGAHGSKGGVLIWKISMGISWAFHGHFMVINRMLIRI